MPCQIWLCFGLSRLLADELIFYLVYKPFSVSPPVCDPRMPLGAHRQRTHRHRVQSHVQAQRAGQKLMCYSAQIERDWRKYLRVMGTEATLDLGDFIKKYWWRQNEFPSMKIPKAVDAWFADPQNGDEQKIAAFIEAFNDQEISKLEQETFKQKKRLADAQRALAIKKQRRPSMISAPRQARLNGHSANSATSSGQTSSRATLESFPAGSCQCLWSHWEEAGEALDRQSSRTSRLPKSLRLVTIAASFRSRKEISTRGLILIQQTSTRCRRFLRIVLDRITSTGWQLSVDCYVRAELTRLCKRR